MGIKYENNGGKSKDHNQCNKVKASLFATTLILTACGSSSEVKALNKPSSTTTTQERTTTTTETSIINKPSINLCSVSQLTTLAETSLNVSTVQCATTSQNMNPSACDMAVFYDPTSGDQNSSLSQIDICLEPNFKSTTDVWGKEGYLFEQDLSGAKNSANNESIVNINGYQGITALRYTSALNLYSSNAEAEVGGKNGILAFVSINEQSQAINNNSVPDEFLGQVIDLALKG